MTLAIDPRPKFHVIAEYPLFGEYDDGTPLDGKEWMNRLFERGIEEKAIVSYNVLTAEPGHWGIQFVVFEVDMHIGMYTDPKFLKRKIKRRLDRVVGDTDVNVRWISRR